MPYARGRGLGGTSIINTRIALRGLREDFNHWAEQGCTGWEWKSVKQTFVAIERDLNFPKAAGHGSTGPLPIWRDLDSSNWGLVSRSFRGAAAANGCDYAEDANAEEASGLSPYPFNADADGIPINVYDAYLLQSDCPESLTIETQKTVARVLIRNQRVVGIEYAGAGGTVEADEVILSAGVAGSPALLARSGIGSQEVCFLAGADFVHPLPIGENLIDHPVLSIPLHVEIAEQPVESEEEGNLGPDRFASYCFLRFSTGLADAGRNDAVIAPLDYASGYPRPTSHGSLSLSLSRVFSRGRLTHWSPDPASAPLLELNSLSDRRDLERMRLGAGVLIDLCNQVIANLPDDSAEECSHCVNRRVSEARTNEQCLEEYIFRCTGTGHHAVGTCRMGSDQDKNSVVDPECRIIGVDGLRVVDASIMPEIPRANPHLTCVMLGEHMARRIAN